MAYLSMNTPSNNCSLLASALDVTLLITKQTSKRRFETNAPHCLPAVKGDATTDVGCHMTFFSATPEIMPKL